MLGYYNAAHQESFWVVERSNDAVIWMNRDELVTVEFEPGTKVMKRNLKVIKTEGEGLVWRKIGPLKPQD